ncbi:hypothetical protein FRACA_3980001 [Frankia canadensis]|uniref:Uncharacterized protein n=1 Tax=Frankia canadensis TaxID=1836972 RepID=A0A2I2KWD7_9ACTN|nr:hypothetical protein FRACA_3980001 [Frankia canadensis]SOU57258.1 hypothetical protein FRACA_3980001 [Frankia canadensis]
MGARAASGRLPGADVENTRDGPADEIVERVLTLLADSADRNRTHPLPTRRSGSSRTHCGNRSSTRH